MGSPVAKYVLGSGMSAWQQPAIDLSPTLANLEKRNALSRQTIFTNSVAAVPGQGAHSVLDHSPVGGASSGGYVSRLMPNATPLVRGVSDGLTFESYEASGARGLIGAAQRSVAEGKSFDVRQLANDLRDYNQGSNVGLGLWAAAGAAALRYGAVRAVDGFFTKTTDPVLLGIIKNFTLAASR